MRLAPLLTQLWTVTHYGDIAFLVKCPWSFTWECVALFSSIPRSEESNADAAHCSPSPHSPFLTGLVAFIVQLFCAILLLAAQPCLQN